jgi:hypothetical protein
MRFSARAPLVPSSGASSKTMGVVSVVFGLVVLMLGFYGLSHI